MTFGEALKIRQQNQADDLTVKRATRHYWNQIFVALLKSWPELVDREIRRVMRTDCKRVALVRTQGWWRISNENLWPFAARAQYCTTRRVSVRTPTQQAEDVIPFSATA